MAGSVLVGLLAASVPALSQVESFGDVPDGHVFASDIEWLASESITRGCNPPDNTLFCPGDPVTRGQMAAFLVRALGLSDSGPGFEDTEGHVFEDDIARLAAAGITRGCNPPDNTLFCPEDPVTRGQMAAFLVRALEIPVFGPDFDDTEGHVFEGDISRLAAAGITRGCNPPANTLFCPDDPVTRGQMAAFLHRALTGAGSPGVESIAVGGYHTCGLDGEGKAWCWGLATDGQLANVSPGESEDTPVRAAQGHTFTAITAGFSHTCALDPEGSAWCWGYNDYGQLGNGEVDTSTGTPGRVTGDHTFVAISAGRYHTCAIDEGGSVWCWGRSSERQLGNGDAPLSDVPDPVLVQGGQVFLALASGGHHSCGIDNVGTWCWGWNEDGQIGNDDLGVHRDTPDTVAGDHAFSGLAAGRFHTCAVDVDGAAWCWGQNEAGQVGNGESLPGADAPVPEPVTGGIDFTTTIGSGTNHTCAVDESGETWCWGFNDYGQLGTGETGTSRSSPQLVGVDRTFVDVDGGRDHTCAVDEDGWVWCWGYNGTGQLGDDSFSDKDTPVAVQFP